MRLYKTTLLCTLLLLWFFYGSVNSGCTKPQDTPIVDTIINPPPPPPLDTVALVKKLSVLTSLYPGYGIVPYRTYTFTYDNLKRLTTVGIKNHSNLVLQDTFTTRLDYTGNSMLPNRIIMPDINHSLLPNPASYDTTWFYYSAGKLQKDSTYERWYGGNDRKPLYRLYTYPDALTTKIDWYFVPNTTTPLQLGRRDTVKLDANGKPDFIKAVYIQNIATLAGGYALAKWFTYSQVVNPLSKLNISGTPYSLIYTNVKKEMLGNDTHPYVYNSNGWADYLDFVSPFVPTLFYIGGYTSTHQTLGTGATSFAVEITPWTVRPTYPAEIRVVMSTSLVGDKYIYRYTY